METQSELHRLAYKLTSDKETANSLLVETTRKALEERKEYTPETSMKHWTSMLMYGIFAERNKES